MISISTNQIIANSNRQSSSSEPDTVIEDLTESRRKLEHKNSHKDVELQDMKPVKQRFQDEDDEDDEGKGKTEASQVTSFSSSGLDEDEEKLPPAKTIRERIHRFFENPTSSKPALMTSMFVMCVIFLGTITFLISSLPQYWLTPPSALNDIEVFCIVVFTTEYLCRLLTAPVWYKWMIVPMNIIDLFAILPFYIELAAASNTSALSIIRVVRLLRIFRVFKVGKYSGKLQVLIKTFQASMDGLLLLAFLVSLALVIFSTAMFYAEQIGQTFDTKTNTWMRDDGSESPYQSIPATFWWCIVTITTVGYGDTFPVTWLGKIIGGVTMLMGILVLAFPISLLGANFTDQWKAAAKEKEKRQAIRRMKKKGLIREMQLSTLVDKLVAHHEVLGEKIAIIKNELKDAKNEFNELTQVIAMIQEHPEIVEIVKQQNAKK